jgi:hypothetical protein
MDIKERESSSEERAQPREEMQQRKQIQAREEMQQREPARNAQPPDLGSGFVLAGDGASSQLQRFKTLGECVVARKARGAGVCINAN